MTAEVESGTQNDLKFMFTWQLIFRKIRTHYWYRSYNFQDFNSLEIIGEIDEVKDQRKKREIPLEICWNHATLSTNDRRSCSTKKDVKSKLSVKFRQIRLTLTISILKSNFTYKSNIK